MDVQSAITYITSPELQQKLLLLKVVFIGFSAFFFGASVYYLSKTGWLRETFIREFINFFFGGVYGLSKKQRYWSKVKRRLETGLETEWKMAILEADDLLDDVLSRAGYTGETLAQKLDDVPLTILPSTEDVRRVHQVRDNIVHDPDFVLAEDQARQAIEVYDRAFSELEAF